jgi:hypothetical protein
MLQGRGKTKMSFTTGTTRPVLPPYGLRELKEQQFQDVLSGLIVTVRVLIFLLPLKPERL